MKYPRQNIRPSFAVFGVLMFSLFCPKVLFSFPMEMNNSFLSLIIVFACFVSSNVKTLAEIFGPNSSSNLVE